MDTLISAFPLALLISLMTFKKGLPSYYALPLVAFILYLLQFFYFQESIPNIHASVVAGLLTAWTPILILWGAIFFFKTMEATGSLALIRIWLNNISRHPIAQVMIIGWAFSFFIEGISGFGTPAVLAAPLLVSLGFQPFKVVVLCLAMNTIPVSFGAVGTPTWFGFGELSLSPEMIRLIGFKTALLQCAASLAIPLLALKILFPWKTLRANLLFIYLSILSTVLPYLLFASFNVEFPSIIGGLVGLITTVLLASHKTGLSTLPITGQEEEHNTISNRDCYRAIFPLLAVVALLIVTRLKGFGIQSWLIKGSPLISFNLWNLGEFHLSSSFVLELRNIFLTNISWKHPLLYIPSLIPFAVIAIVCFFFFKISAKQIQDIWSESLGQITKPLYAMLGAMVFVKLFMLGGERAPASLLGYGFANVAGGAWNFAAVYLGALGSFFAGSCTVSNLTFGPIQMAVAGRLHQDLSLILSLQSVGGSMGNMVCIHNIVAVCAILGLQNQEGKILRKTGFLVLIYGFVVGSASFLFLFNTH